MGFNRIAERLQERTQKAGSIFSRNYAKAAKTEPVVLKGAFIPSTQKEIARYAEEAKRIDAERAKRASKERVKFTLPKLDYSLPFEAEALDIDALIVTFRECMEERRRAYALDKKADPRWAPKMPRYEAFEKPEIADSNFVHDMQSCIAGFDWNQLTRLINTAAGQKYRTKDYSEAFHIFQNIMHVVMAIRIDSSGVRYALGDRKRILRDWKIQVIQRGKEKPMNNDDVKPKLRAQAREVEVDEGVADIEEADDEGDEDEPTPKKKKVDDKRKPRKRKKPIVDEDEDHADDPGDPDDDDWPDDDDEEPAPKKVKGAKSSSKKRRVVVEDEDGDDEDSDADDKPKSKRKKTVAAAKTNGRSKTAKRKTPTRRTPVKVAKLKPDTLIKKGEPRESGGAKTKLQALVKRAGIPYADLLVAAKEAGLPVPKVKTWVPSLIKGGYLKAVEPAAEAA